MKLRKLFFISLGIVFLSQFIYSNMNKSPYEKALAEYDRLSAKYINDMCQKHNLYPFGDGGGFLDNINRLYFCFKSEKDLNIEELEVILLDVSIELLQRVNANLKIRPHLVKFPYDENGISIQVFTANKIMQKRKNIYSRMCSTSRGKMHIDVNTRIDEGFHTVSTKSFSDMLKLHHLTHPNSAFNGVKLRVFNKFFIHKISVHIRTEITNDYSLSCHATVDKPA